MADRAKFRALFKGASSSHGTWDTKKDVASTKRTPASDEAWAGHLDGLKGLGQVPVREDKTCAFVAIDIDVNDIDHGALAAKIKALSLPLWVCRSKSGGAHCYLFLAEPGRPAKWLRKYMHRCAVAIGYPKAEIFPKQDQLLDGTTGNWINLPYFNCVNSSRYAVNAQNVPYTFAEFLAAVDPWPVDQPLPEPLKAGDGEADHAGMPPCLEHIMAHGGFQEGERNNGLFNMGVYLRKSDTEGWKEALAKFNYAGLKQPVSLIEIKTITRSVDHKKYEYLCQQPPIVSHCQRAVCLTRKYGIAQGGSGKTDEEYDEFLIGGLKKVLTTPPRYLLEVNGVELDLRSETFGEYLAFRKVVREVLNLVIRPMKQSAWEMIMKAKLASREDLDAPPEASEAGKTEAHLHVFLELRSRAKKREDILKHLPFEEEGLVYFRGLDFQQYLQRFNVKVEGTSLHTLLRARGCAHTTLSIKGKTCQLYKVPAAALNEQQEGFTVEPPKKEEF